MTASAHTTTPRHFAPQASRGVVVSRYADGLMSALPTSSVAALTGMTLRQLRYLAQNDVVTPTVRSGAGRGSEAMYAPGDLLALLVVERVRAVCGHEVRIERIRSLVDALRRRQAEPGQHLVMDGEGFWVQDGTPEDTLRRSGAALIVDLDALAEELAVRLRRAGLISEARQLAA